PGSRPAPPPRFAPAKPLGKGLGRGHAMPHVLSLPGLEGVIGADARGLVAQFGPARLDVHEGEAQKLQFAGEACVLDVYLYPGEGGGPARATYVDARRASDGRDVDRAGCVAALKRR
ncbi:MAG TPA: hypothetical protein VFF98_17935, partial [Novosphingobium sp.]|nr:hypothetical protein [Novosphingobium sp.]